MSRDGLLPVVLVSIPRFPSVFPSPRPAPRRRFPPPCR